MTTIREQDYVVTSCHTMHRLYMYSAACCPQTIVHTLLSQ